MKRLIICADGTWNTPDQEDREKRAPSNIVKMARAIQSVSADGVPQIVYYHLGVGTHKSFKDKFLGGGLGVGLSTNIINCYRFIAHNYVEGDEIFLFGFSRGAYTVRSLAGLIGKVGILPKANIFYLKEAYDCYKYGFSEKGDLKAFKQKYDCEDILIKFIGVWDTVGALGIPKIGIGLMKSWLTRSKHDFHDVQLGQHIRHAYHALAIDEKRKPFAPTLWKIEKDSTQTLEQVWFPGVHSNIGGGYGKGGLSNISFQWLKTKAEEHGLSFNKEFTKYYVAFWGDELRDSFTFSYRIVGAYNRPIGMRDNTNEKVDQSAFVRYKEMKDYRPANLVSYIERNGIKL